MVVVGVDGSAGSRAALAFALDEGARRRCWLRVVTAFEPASYRGVADAEVEGEVVRRTREFVNEVLDRLRRDGPVVPLSIVAVAGPAGTVLVAESEGSALLVVGHSGRGLLARAAQGSVGRFCVLNASCPVTIVPWSGPGVRTPAGEALLTGAALP
jgi:nucleotide-binding universal stress UspA family protein